MKSIFVNICSYRDNLLTPTIESLLATESGRNKIIYGIFEQTDHEDSLEKKNPEIIAHPRVRYKRIDAKYSDGVMWARHMNSLQLQEEDFQYQIDSHMLFDKDWDHQLILDYNQARKIANTDKIILSAGCKNYDLHKNVITKHILDEDVTTELKYFQFDKSLRLHAHGPWKKATETVMPGIHICAGNFFTTSKWIKDVGYNTKIFFEGEEQVLSLSSFIAGYKIFHHRSIKVYHYLSSSNHQSKQTINPIDVNTIARRQEISANELIDYIYSIDESVLEDYRKHTGVDYINRKLEERCITRHMSPPEGVINDWEIPNREE